MPECSLAGIIALKEGARHSAGVALALDLGGAKDARRGLADALAVLAQARIGSAKWAWLKVAHWSASHVIFTVFPSSVSWV